MTYKTLLAFTVVFFVSSGWAFQPDVQAYCQESASRRVSPEYDRKAPERFLKITFRSQDYPYFSYYMSKSPSLDNQKLGLLHARKNYDLWVSKQTKSNPTLAEVFDFKSYKHPLAISSQARAEAKALFETVVKKHASIRNQALSLAGTSTCILGCTQAMSRVLDLMSAVRVDGRELDPMRFGDLTYFSAPKVLKNIFLKDQYSKATYLLLQKVISNKGERRFHEDVRSAVNEFFQTEPEREEAYWTFLGFYGTRGASVSLLFPYFHDDYFPLLGSLLMIHTMGSYYELERNLNGSSYYIPSNQKSLCSYGGHYHFWMSAYLAHELKTEGFNPKDILQAVTQSGLNYEYYMYMGQKSFHNHPQNDWWQNFKTFQDLASGRMGALFGLNQLNQDFDLIMENGLKNFPPIKMHRRQQTFPGILNSNYFTWKKAVGGDLIDQIKSEMND